MLMFALPSMNLLSCGGDDGDYNDNENKTEKTNDEQDNDNKTGVTNNEEQEDTPGSGEGLLTAGIVDSSNKVRITNYETDNPHTYSTERNWYYSFGYNNNGQIRSISVSNGRHPSTFYFNYSGSNSITSAEHEPITVSYNDLGYISALYSSNNHYNGDKTKILYQYDGRHLKKIINEYYLKPNNDSTMSKETITLYWENDIITTIEYTIFAKKEGVITSDYSGVEYHIQYSSTYKNNFNQWSYSLTHIVNLKGDINVMDKIAWPLAMAGFFGKGPNMLPYSIKLRDSKFSSYVYSYDFSDNGILISEDSYDTHIDYKYDYKY